MSTFDEKYCLDTFQALLGIDSTTGQYEEIQEWMAGEIRRLGFEPQLTRKGGVIADLGGEGKPLVITAHLDDIGLIRLHFSVTPSPACNFIIGMRKRQCSSPQKTTPQ